MISLNWVKDYLDLQNVDLKKLAEETTKTGVNIEKVITSHIDHLVIGEVTEVIDHPNSDHLHICQVNVGSESLQIVCGAPNVRKDLKVIVALPGAVLPGDFVIKVGKIRDVESNGMICALFELGLEEKTEENYNKGIHELDSNAPVGSDALAYLGFDDTFYEVDIHKHRNNDCYYHIGFAYLLGTILNKEVKLPEMTYSEITDNVNNYIKLDVKTNKCPYYIGKMVKNVVIKESPEFIKKRLLAVGMRPINNVVDISNYVMLEYGQPMHFFDYDKLGGNVLVRDAIDTEVIKTLDGVERILTKDDIVITNGDKPVCIAGVMGGFNTEITDDTKTIFIESAIFDPISIRNTANRLNLKSEASIRYGKGLNYEFTENAINRACYLLEKYADATILTDTVMHDNLDKTPKVITFSPLSVNSILGINITPEDMAKELRRLHFNFDYKDGNFIATIPNYRLDMELNVNDIAEEIGRLYGYHNLISTTPVLPVKKGEYKGDVGLKKQISKRLRSLLLNEVKTYTLTSMEMSNTFKYDDKDGLLLPNPMSNDKSVIRNTILPSLINVFNYNKARKVNDINIYEISKTYDSNLVEDTKIALLLSGNYIVNNWQHSGLKVDFFLVKGIVENLLDYLGYKNRYSFVKNNINDLHPGIGANIILDKENIGIIGRVHTNITKDEVYVVELSLNALNKPVKALKYKEPNKYPEIKKDMAFVVKNDITANDIINEIKHSGGRLLTNIDIFDVYTGTNVLEGTKSIAFNLTFSDTSRTLSDEEVTKVFNNIISNVTTKFNAELRDK